MTRVTSRLMGGLGNQMFQYAAARALALRRGAEVQLDLSSFATEAVGVTPRHYELNPFPIAAETVSDAILASADAARPATGLFAPGTRISRVLRRVGWGRAEATGVNYYREPHYRFDPGLAAQPLPLLMEGYWQSERYFVEAADTIRRELTPSAPLEPENAATAAEIDGVEAVSVHVRRGDYVTNATAATFHGTCSLDYYRAAVDLVRQRVARPHLFVFSDDRVWMRDNLHFDLPTTYVSANPPDRGFRDMQLMSRCRHHIIANSSFSWWGAWLNPRRDKLVVAPERWFAGHSNDTSDLLPQDWIRV